MKTKFYSLVLSLAALPFFSQQSGWVGINTPIPTASLDVNGTLKVHDMPLVTALPGYQIMAVDEATSQVSKIDSNAFFSAVNTNASVYAAKKTSGISLVNLGVFPSGFRSINFLTTERTVGAASLFSDSDNTYTIPSTGVYAISYSFRYGTGLQAALLSSSPGIGILRDRAGVGTMIDTRSFSGANLGLVSLTISEASINALYMFQAGDKVSFGLTGTSALELGLLGSSTAAFSIYKVSN
ncbi:hypothetical protein [Chryseobacterium gossypii]|uniref:hypothetical protein n=1 Tax=Chryseobacterium gossypii TaxID=3231602 RepID=UPI003526072A